MWQRFWMIGICLLFVAGAGVQPVCAQQPPEGLSEAERGYWFLLNKPFLTPDFDQQMFDNLWRVWPEELRVQAETASPEERQQMTFQRYGFTQRPDAEAGAALQYVKTAQGGWVMNCFACHGGQVGGRVIPGLPNSNFAMQTLTEDIRQVKPLIGRKLSTKDVAGWFFPMGSTVGTTNAVMFGVALENYRDEHLNVVPFRRPPTFTHHDMDAPPWWHYKKKKYLYADGFVEKNHRALIPFVLIRSNDAETIRAWEADFQDISAYLESIESPPYPYAIDTQLARQGEGIFNHHCASCHGTYGEKETYDPPLVTVEEVGTDPVRLQALTREHRANYSRSWLAHYGQQETITEPVGYVPPPLDGIWASAPYFHNGSVPTLWHLLHAQERPSLWKRTETGYDVQRVGLEIEQVESVPGNLPASQQRYYFRTDQFGKSAAGHLYPEALTEQEKQSLLEYLKTL